jgi:hypothetical protein
MAALKRGLFNLELKEDDDWSMFDSDDFEDRIKVKVVEKTYTFLNFVLQHEG